MLLFPFEFCNAQYQVIFSIHENTKYIDDELEYADQSIALAFLAVEEAKVAFLNAVEAQQEYDEKYGDDE